MKKSRYLLLVGILVGLAGCSSNSSGGTNVGNLKPTWTNVYTAVLAKKCLPCHSTSTGVSLGQLDLTMQDKAYVDLVGVKAAGSMCAGKGTLVVAGDASSSLLYQKLSSSPPCGAMMPFGRAPLSSSEQDLIKNWINAGAANN